MDIIKKSKSRYSDIFNKLLVLLGFKNYIVFIIIMIIISVMFFIYFWNKPLKYSLLYDNLSIESQKVITKTLVDMSIPYYLKKETGTIMIPKDQIYALKLYLSKNEFMKEPHVGYELLDKEGFGISQFNEQVNYQRALEGELEKTIQKLNNIRYAKVHLSLPKYSLFLHSDPKVSAAVSLVVDKNKKIDYEEIRAIVHLVSSSVSGLLLSNVTIIDQYGHVLNQSGKEYNELHNNYLKYMNTVEEKYSRKVKEILIPLFGLENVYVKVTAQINFDTQDYTEEIYSPNFLKNKKSIRSSHKSVNQQLLNKDYIYEKDNDDINDNFLKKKLQDKNKYKDKNVLKKEILNNEKKDVHQSLKNNPEVNSDYEDTINYELDRKIIHTKLSKGRIKNISIAVVINYVKTSTGKFIPLSTYNIKKIKKLIKKTIGFSKERGDGIEILNYLFFKPEPKIIILKNVNKNSFIQTDYLLKHELWLIVVISILIIVVLIIRKKIISYNADNINNKTTVFQKKNNNIEKILTKNTTDIKESNKSYSDKKIKDLRDNDIHTIATVIRHWINKKL